MAIAGAHLKVMQTQAAILGPALGRGLADPEGAEARAGPARVDAKRTRELAGMLDSLT